MDSPRKMPREISFPTLVVVVVGFCTTANFWLAPVLTEGVLDVPFSLTVFGVFLSGADPSLYSSPSRCICDADNPCWNLGGGDGGGWQIAPYLLLGSPKRHAPSSPISCLPPLNLPLHFVVVVVVYNLIPLAFIPSTPFLNKSVTLKVSRTTPLSISFAVFQVPLPHLSA